MSIAYSDRCTASSWRGDPDHSLAGKGRCIKPNALPHTDHRDENGNNFLIIDGVSHVIDVHGKVLS